MDFSDIRDRGMKDVVPQIKHFVGSSWTPERIARAVGAEVRGRETSIVTPILLIAVGALIGGVVALALAPKSGHDLRSDLMEKVNDLRNGNGKKNDKDQATA